MKINSTSFYSRVQSIPDSSSDSEWSDDEDLYTPISQQDECLVSDTDEDSIDPNENYLVIPASDGEKNFLLKMCVWMVWIIIPFMKIEIAANILLVHKKTMISCSKCQIDLCINDKRNWFLLFHTQ